MKRLFHVILFMLFLFPCQTRASQVFGGEVTYRHLGGLKWEVTFKFYRDCRGTSVDTIYAEMRAVSGSSARKTMSLTRVSIADVTHYCEKNSNPCEKPNTSGASLGIEEHIFLDTIDINKADSAFKKACHIQFGFGLCCNNAGKFWVYSELNICLKKPNSSPVLSNKPLNILCCNQPVFINMGAIDTLDYDSLSYSWTSSMADWNTKSTCSLFVKDYWPPGSPKNPNPNVNPPIGTYLDPETGDIITTPTDCNQIACGSILVSEWRKDSAGNYKKIGEIRRDMDYIVQSCSPNNPPTLNGPYKYDICAGEQICFTISSDDKQYVPAPPATKPPPDTVILSWNGGPGKGATFKILDTTARLQKGRFCWTPKASDASDLPYTFTVTARDNNCPMNGVAIKSYSVKVKKIAKTKITRKFIKNGLYELKSEADTGFKGTPTYSWWISDTNNHFISDYYFHTNTGLKSSKYLDSVQFYKAGKYIITHTINNPPLNCPAVYFDTINVLTVIPVLKIQPTVLQEKWVCKNTMDTIFTILQDARKPVRFRWSSSKADTLPYLIVKNTQDASYRVDVYDSAGYHKFANWKFNVYQEPVLKMDKDILACVGDTVSLAATGTNYADTVFWKWYFEGNPISTSPKIQVVKPGVYSLEISDSNQCISKRDSMKVSNMTVNVNAGMDRRVCITDTVMLNAKGLDTLDGKKGVYYWYINTLKPKASDTGSSIPFIFKKDSSMIVKLIQTKGTLSCTDLDTVTVSFRPLPHVLLGKSSICQNDIELDLHTIILKPVNSHKGIVSWQLTKTLKRPGGGNNSVNDLVYDKDNSANDLYYLKADKSHIDLAGKFTDSVKLLLYYEDEFGCRNVSSHEASIIIKANVEIAFKENELKRCYGDSVKYISNDFGVNYYGGKWFTNNDSSDYSKWPQGNSVQLSEKLGTGSLEPKGGKYLLRYLLENNKCFTSRNALLTINPYPIIVWEQSDKGDSIILTDKSVNSEKREWHVNGKKWSESVSIVISKMDAKQKTILLKVFNTTCETDSILKPEVLIGIKTMNNLLFSISPNPVRKELFIKTYVNLPWQLEIVNSLGQIVFVKTSDKKEESIDLTDFPNGIYNVVLKTGNEVLMQKFIKMAE